MLKANDTIATVQDVDLVDDVTSVDTIDEVTNVTSVDLIDDITSLDTVDEVTNVTSVDTVDTVTTVTTVSTVTGVTEVSNVTSVDLVDTVTDVTTVSTVSTVAEVTNVTSVDTVDTVTSVTDVANVTSVDLVDVITSITNAVTTTKPTTQVTLMSSATKTATWQTTGVDVSNYNEAYIHVDVTAFDRGDADELLILDIEVSHDNSTWIHRATVVDETTEGDLTTTTGDSDRGKLKATGDYIVFIRGGLGLYMRLNGTVSGTTPSITLSAIGNFK